ncbi:MAG: hypothetical protein ABII07_05860 [Patescibacteria group bacterium]|nr:hypothetical protein [Patescibacteria group bacterium]
MLSTLSQTVGLPIISEQAEGPVALIKDILIDPNNGGVTGVAILMSKKIVATSDIRSWTPEGIKVVDETAIIERSEIIKQQISILGHAVFDKNEKFLGIVHDFVVDTEVSQLKQIFVKKSIIFIPIEKRIIDYRDIVEILPDRIVVKNGLAPSKEKVRAFVAMKKMTAATG